MGKAVGSDGGGDGGSSCGSSCGDMIGVIGEGAGAITVPMWGTLR